MCFSISAESLLRVFCSDQQQYRCDEPGLAFPHAGPGYFLSLEPTLGLDESPFAVEMVDQCVPFEACLGSCPDEVLLDVEAPDYSLCSGATGNASCSDGYTGDRCSACVALDAARDCTPDHLNGFYRLDGRCEPCPCSWITFTHVIIVVVIVLLLGLAAFDCVSKRVSHISTVVAPLMIVITFCQTIAVLLDLDVTWPDELRELMQMLHVFNVNLQLARPECSFKFGIQQKLDATLGLPVLVVVVLALYVGIKLLLACRQNADDFAKKHGGKTPLHFAGTQAVVVLCSSFVFLSVFILRTAFQAFNCKKDIFTGARQRLC